MVYDPRIRAGIFAGESGGDYNALFGYQNRPDGRFSNVNLTSMPISEVLAFTDPSGPYAQYVKGQVGRVATPVGAYQVVGSTLRDAVNALGLDPSTPFSQATQDRIGQWILENQGTGAWEGYQPNAQPTTQISTSGAPAMPMTPQQPQGILGSLGIQKQDPAATDQTALPFYQRDRFKDTMGNLAMAFNELRMQPSQNIGQIVSSRQERRAGNRTIEWLAQQPGGEAYVQMIQAGGNPAAVLQAYQQAQAPRESFQTVSGQQLIEMGMQGANPNALYKVNQLTGEISQVGGGGTTVNVGGQPTTPGWEAIDKAYADIWLNDSTSGLADVASQAAQISDVLGKLESGEQLTGPMTGVQPDFVRAITNPEAQDAKDRVEQVVQRSLRQTLGAQFAQAEGDRLIARAYNVNLPPAANAARLRALFTSLQSVAEQKAAMRDYFNQNNTLQGFNGNVNIPTVDDFIAAMDSAAPAPASEVGGNTTSTGITWSID